MKTLTDRPDVHDKREELILYLPINRGIPLGERYELFGKCFGEIEKV